VLDTTPSAEGDLPAVLSAWTADDAHNIAARKIEKAVETTRMVVVENGRVFAS
jgi:hypothetical protein